MQHMIKLTVSILSLCILPLSILAGLASCADVNNSEQEAAQVDGVQSENADSYPAAVKLPASDFKQVDWTQLMPKEDLDALMNPPEYLVDIEDGSSEDQISSELQSATAASSDDRYQQALVSTRVVADMDGQAIKIPGFIVPLEFNDDQTTTQFFLVPYFGACLHMPPPPPNQIIFVEYPDGIQLESLTEPFWISGVLSNALIENDMATASYSMKMHYFERYLP